MVQRAANSTYIACVGACYFCSKMFGAGNH